ncbi:SDR family NAD(P)-dependent oxidoreductase [Pelagibius litoralis]|uniref:SDR family NAD(P)-dependent oxidoreductase n=1 Tax=Pelagibius litoralis TaxID=374515 RepID=A0A967F0G1_9PROT|nr:SDR family NAD(P)-dependent oxidoreductase [Pelagibius litoralis]NIA70792.1 SDR family NAD(P)-dependent oxidoreductase [Pelagibius litoralis]
MADQQCCVIVGVGPGLGAAVARRFAAAGYAVALASRNPDRLAPLVAEIAAAGGSARAYRADATDETEVTALFDAAEKDLGPIGVAVFNASGRVRKPIAEIEAQEFIDAWMRGCFGGFLVGREAARRMQPRNAGTILFTGATASVKAFPLSAGFAVAKYGLRALAESMARALQPEGIHVAHFVIDGAIGSDETNARLDPTAIAETYYQTHAQHPSAWSSSVELRPWTENF